MPFPISLTPVRRFAARTALLNLALSLTATLCSAPTEAHVVLDQKTAVAGSYFRGAFRVGHGCDGSATVAITVNLPEGVRGAKPMPKAGWTIERTTAAVAKPYDSHGKKVTEEVTAITWRGGPLPDAFFDEFAVQMQVPATPGAVWFNVRQQCEIGEINWATTPTSGTSTRGIKAPAALLEITPAPTAPAQAIAPETAHKH
jgi:periplasmic copper chaperone A